MKNQNKSKFQELIDGFNKPKSMTEIFKEIYGEQMAQLVHNGANLKPFKIPSKPPSYPAIVLVSEEDDTKK